MVYQCEGPKVSLTPTVFNVTPFASAVFAKTVFPHHVRIVFTPMLPLAGYCRQKKMSTMLTATPESIAAERTSRLRQDKIPSTHI